VHKTPVLFLAGLVRVIKGLRPEYFFGFITLKHADFSEKLDSFWVKTNQKHVLRFSTIFNYQTVQQSYM